MTEKILSEYPDYAGDEIAKQLARVQLAIAELQDNRDLLEKLLDDQLTLEEAKKEAMRLAEEHRLADGSLPTENCPTL